MLREVQAKLAARRAAAERAAQQAAAEAEAEAAALADAEDDGPDLVLLYRYAAINLAASGALDPGLDAVLAAEVAADIPEPWGDALVGLVEQGETAPREFEVYYRDLFVGTRPDQDAALALWQATWCMDHGWHDG